MSDDIEDLLRRFRPLGPPPELRARALSRGISRAFEWLPATAAVAAIVVFYWLASVEHARIASRVNPAPPIERGIGVDLQEPPR